MAQAQSNVNVEKQAGEGAGLHVPASARAHRPPAPVARKASLPRRKASSDRTPVRVSGKKSEHGVDVPREGTSAEPGPGARDVNYNSTAPPAPLATSLAQAVSPSSHSHPQSPASSPSSHSAPPPASAPAPISTNYDPEAGLPPPQYSRRPPTYPVLLPEYRYCGRDGLVKPMRAHHCRVCGTVSLLFIWM